MYLLAAADSCHPAASRLKKMHETGQVFGLMMWSWTCKQRWIFKLNPPNPRLDKNGPPLHGPVGWFLFLSSAQDLLRTCS